MSAPCQHCRHHNPSGARFCGRCGRSLIGPASVSLGGLPGPRPRRKRCCGFSSALGLLFLGAVGIYWMGSQGRHRSIWSEADVRRSIDLAPAKARALFDLLAPDDVAVTVGPHDRGRFTGGRRLSVRGTSSEVRTIERFAGLLTRLDAEHHDRPVGGWTRGPSAGMCERTYTLSRSKAKSLARLLAFDDVPVFVTRLGAKLAISAAAKDQEIIAGVVRILGGKAYRCE